MSTDEIYNEILEDTHDITPKWRPVSPTFLSENVISSSDMYYFYCNQLAKLDHEHRTFILNFKRTYDKIKQHERKLNALNEKLSNLKIKKIIKLKNYKIINKKK